MLEEGAALGAAPSSPLLEAALHYAQLGYGVFPCICGGKAPATRNGFKDATADPSYIREFFGVGHNIGLIAPSDVLVLDFDVSKDTRIFLAQRRAATRQRPSASGGQIPRVERSTAA